MTDPRILPHGQKAIPLTKGMFAIVDAADYEWLAQWKWHVNAGGYAVRKEYHGMDGRKPIQSSTYMHRLIMSAPKGMEVDHIDGDRLMNVRSNLRLCTHAENHRNRGADRGSTSRHKGVHWYAPYGKWRAKILVDGKEKNLGSFHNEDDAAMAYNRAALEHFGAFARLNNVACRNDEIRLCLSGVE